MTSVLRYCGQLQWFMIIKLFLPYVKVTTPARESFLYWTNFFIKRIIILIGQNTIAVESKGVIMIRQGKIICPNSSCPTPVVKDTKWRCEQNHDVPPELQGDHNLLNSVAGKHERSTSDERPVRSIAVNPQRAHERAHARHRNENLLPFDLVEVEK